MARRVLLTFSGGAVVNESAAGLGGYRFFRMNSSYDVDTTLGSSAVPGFAEWANFYANYRVWRTRVRIEGQASGGSAGSVATVAIVPQAYTSTIPSNASTWSVQPYSAKKTVSMYTSGGTNFFKIDKTFNIPSLLHVSTNQFLNEANYSANTSSNPSTQVYWAATVLGVGTTSVTTIFFQVYQSMLVEFFNPITVSI